MESGTKINTPAAAAGVTCPKCGSRKIEYCLNRAYEGGRKQKVSTNEGGQT